MKNKEDVSQKLAREILSMLSGRIAAVLGKIIFPDDERLEEIRLRADQPLMLLSHSREWFIGRDGNLAGKAENSFIVLQEDIGTCLEIMSENSIYAYQEEIRNGYVTIKGGHRVGLTGKVVADGHHVKNIRDIAGLNIRISNQIIGCSAKVLPYLIRNQSDIFNTLIVSPPQCGKTTILRDIARALSDGFPDAGFRGVKVGIVDERSELAACLHGIPQNNVGMRTDVLDGCPKTVGMAMLVRSMSPQVVITDEIGNEGDREAVHGVLNAGVKIVTSAHGYNITELKSRREVLRMIEDRLFDRYVVLGNTKGPGTLMEITDGNLKPLLGAGLYAV